MSADTNNRAPIWVAEVEINVSTVAPRSANALSLVEHPVVPLRLEGNWKSARLLVRLDRAAVGMISVDFDSAGHLDERTVLETIWSELGGRIGALAAVELDARIAGAGRASRDHAHLGPRVAVGNAAPSASEMSSGVTAESSPTGATHTMAGSNTALPTASVVLCTRDRPHRIVAAVEGLLALDYPSVEIIVVDNSTASEETSDLLAAHWAAEPSVRCVRERRPGLSFARNTGVEAAAGEIVAFTDDDITTSPDWLSWLVQALGRAPGVVAATGSVLPHRLETESQVLFEQMYGWSFKSGFAPRLFDIGANSDGSVLWPFTPGVVGGGGNSAYRRDVYMAEGGCDVALGAGTRTGGGEDLDLFCRLLRGGHQIAFEPSAVVWHDHRVTGDELAGQIEAYGVGLAAFLTKQLIGRETAIAALKRVPAGIGRFLQPGGNSSEDLEIPRELQLAAWRGRARGPLEYARSRRLVQSR